MMRKAGLLFTAVLGTLFVHGANCDETGPLLRVSKVQLTLSNGSHTIIQLPVATPQIAAANYLDPQDVSEVEISDVPNGTKPGDNVAGKNVLVAGYSDDAHKTAYETFYNIDFGNRQGSPGHNYKYCGMLISNASHAPQEGKFPTRFVVSKADNKVVVYGYVNHTQNMEPKPEYILFPDLRGAWARLEIEIVQARGDIWEAYAKAGKCSIGGPLAVVYQCAGHECAGSPIDGPGRLF